jgi:hypothetical protein
VWWGTCLEKLRRKGLPGTGDEYRSRQKTAIEATVTAAVQQALSANRLKVRILGAALLLVGILMAAGAVALPSEGWEKRLLWVVAAFVYGATGVGVLKLWQPTLWVGAFLALPLDLALLPIFILSLFAGVDVVGAALFFPGLRALTGFAGQADRQPLARNRASATAPPPGVPGPPHGVR